MFLPSPHPDLLCGNCSSLFHVFPVGLPIMVCCPQPMDTWPGLDQSQCYIPLTSGIDPGWQFRGFQSGSYLCPLIALRWKLQVTKKQANQSILFFLNPLWLQCNCPCPLQERGDSSVALMGTHPWSWCRALSDGWGQQRVCKQDRKAQRSECYPPF